MAYKKVKCDFCKTKFLKRADRVNERNHNFCSHTCMGAFNSQEAERNRQQCAQCTEPSYSNNLCRKHYDEKYYISNKSKRKLQIQKYDKSHKNDRNARARKRNKERYKTDTLYRFSRKIRRVIIRAFKQLNMIKNGKTFKLLGYAPQDLNNKMVSYINSVCEECNITIIDINNSAMDHIIPMCSASSKEDIIKLNQLNNLRLICRHCNSIKLSQDLKFKKKQKSSF